MREPLSPVVTTRRVLGVVLAVDLTVIVVSILRGETPDEFFLEGRSVTAFSFAQLQVMLALAVCIATRRHAGGRLHRSPAALWVLMAVGFSLLSLDETLTLHELVDARIHGSFGIKETGLTDRLDDLIVGVYGPIALCVLWYYRDEMARFRAAWPLLAAGFVGFAIGVALDLLGNRPDLATRILGSEEGGLSLQAWINVVEESTKLVTEGVFIAALARSATIAADLSARAEALPGRARD